MDETTQRPQARAQDPSSNRWPRLRTPDRFPSPRQTSKVNTSNSGPRSRNLMSQATFAHAPTQAKTAHAPTQAEIAHVCFQCVRACSYVLVCFGFACASLCSRSAISVGKFTAVGGVFCTFLSGACAKSDFGFQIHRCGRCFLRVSARSEITPRNLRCFFASLCFSVSVHARMHLCALGLRVHPCAHALRFQSSKSPLWAVFFARL